MTNSNIRNPYLRSLAAREVLGWRMVYAKTKNYPGGMDKAELLHYVDAAKMMTARIDLHLRRHAVSLVAGDTTPLAEYAASFAGHS